MRADTACAFLRTNANFIEWYSAAGCQQLAIVGEMGSGKSVSMAFLVDELHRRNRLQLPQPKNATTTARTARVVKQPTYSAC